MQPVGIYCPGHYYEPRNAILKNLVEIFAVEQLDLRPSRLEYQDIIGDAYEELLSTFRHWKRYVIIDCTLGNVSDIFGYFVFWHCIYLHIIT